ncbi:AMP-binding protein [Tumebacillus permanentifrigoris]|uniref:Long-chain acyl-CoA synthetase/crotonobetaine/carnitine-CoA ligase n=1 Tax=Tumebacillus permanentifrigoris TaxID=378543 RepID=A0A316DD72_9BACL|nr:AMP-binding protein [Tumebacillus permanentifrigoris]PWK15636.1 long-chain acyl-CoA synthetase/crotonobetaine/carnitine-CoA ligase [Tumebacillus permanentifrigoris]
MTLGELLEAAVLKAGDRPFLVQIGQANTVSYELFNRQVNGLAHGLRALGVLGGESVGVVLPNGPELLYLLFAMAKLGGVLVPLNPALTVQERDELLTHAEVVVLIGDMEVLDAHQNLPRLRAQVTVGERRSGAVPFESLLVPSEFTPDLEVAASDPVALLYTSGTTGRPKGCLLSHDSYVIPAHEFVRWIEVTPEDRFMGCLPLFHMAGQSFAASAVAGGASIALVSKFSGSRFWEQVHQSGATVFRHLGEMLALLVQSPQHPLERSHKLRAVYGGGARAELLDAFQKRFGVRVVEGYGLSETNTVLANSIALSKEGSIGKAAAYHEVRIADDGGHEVAVGSVGEIQVRKNRVMMREYFKAPEVTERAFCEGWYLTGDLGYCDEEGYYYFVSRKKDIIRRRGENIAPAGIEDVLNRHEQVGLSAVIGVPDRFGGEDIKAFVMPTEGSELSVDSLLTWCRMHLAAFKVPRYWEICENLPRTATNKVNKGMLRAQRTLGGVEHEVQLERT